VPRDRVKLPEIFRFELADFELNCDEVVQSAMKEQQVQGEISAVYLERVLRTDKAEVAAEFDQERPQLVEQSPMQIRVCVNGRRPQKFQVVSDLEDADRFGMRLSHHWRDFWRAFISRTLANGGVGASSVREVLSRCEGDRM